MRTYMPILYALQSGKLKQEDFIEYMPDEMRNLQRLNGRNDYTTEFFLGWHAVIYKGFGVFLVSDQPTKANITVSEKGIKYDLLKKYATLYDNKQIDTMSVVLTSELYEMIPKNLRRSNIWIYSENTKFRKYYSYERESSFLYGRRIKPSQSYISSRYYTKNMLPIIFIPPDTIVEIEEFDNAGKTNENAFRIFPRKSKQISVSKSCLDEFKVPMWVTLKEAMLVKAICSENFVQYVSSKENEFYIEETYRSDNILKSNEGWHPQLISEKDDCYVQIASGNCERFSEDIYPDIIKGIIKFDKFNGDDPIPLLKVYLRLNLKEIQMFVKAHKNVMIQVNNPEYDGTTPEKAYKLKIEDEN